MSEGEKEGREGRREEGIKEGGEEGEIGNILTTYGLYIKSQNYGISGL